MKNPDHIRQVYCIGLGGVGVAAVAKMFLAQGVKVSGSDPNQNPLVDDLVKAGVKWHQDADADHITGDIDLVVATDDAPDDQPERLAAQRRGITCENFSLTLGRLMAGYKQRLCVAGTNGKSTTAALTGLLLAGVNLDPTVFVGSRVKEFKGNLRLGNNSIFVAEADEYRDHFLNYAPTVVTLANIEPDHLDYFRTAENMMASYKKFVTRLPSTGVLVANADDPIVMQLTATANKVITFGIQHEADLRAVDIKQTAGKQTWTTLWRGASLGIFTIYLPGQFNIMNALAAMAGALAVGVGPSTFGQTIASFRGVWRRFQILNPKSSITIISDYAHHPTAVRVTLEGAKQFYPGRRLVAVFQPHHQSRLTALFDDFTTSFGSADEVMIVETYTVPGRAVAEKNPRTALQLVVELKKRNNHVTYVSRPAEAEPRMKKLLQPGDVAVIMGAGDIWRHAENLGQYYA